MIEGSTPPILPDDEYNRRLVQNVHPSHWRNPEPSGRYNLIVRVARCLLSAKSHLTSIVIS